MGREMEHKFRLSGAQFARLLAEYPNCASVTMETLYYDTKEKALGAARATFRRRLENGRPVYTLKTPLPDGSRGEWETEAKSLEEGLATLQLASGENVLAGVTAADLREECGARFLRRCTVIPYPGGAAELALDEGILLAGSKTEPLCEAELELKEGSDEAFLQFSAAFREKYALEEQPLSKFARARNLAL